MIFTEDNWQLHPIPGESGDAYMGVRLDDRIFLKRNTSPFIATVAAEGIVPKLRWTERTYSGDTLTAQDWTYGRILDRSEMTDSRVIEMLQRIHQSEHLLIMLQRVGGSSLEPEDFIQKYYEDLSSPLQTNHFLNEVVHHLHQVIDDDLLIVEKVVCHGDIHHNNFIEDPKGHLYLVDWEEVKIADPFSDLSAFLLLYLSPRHWGDWLIDYGAELNDTTLKRIRWYTMMNCLYYIKQFHREGRQHKMNEMILQLKQIYNSR